MMFRRSMDAGDLATITGALSMFISLFVNSLCDEGPCAPYPSNQEVNQSCSLPNIFFTTGTIVFSFGLMMSLAHNAKRGQEEYQENHRQRR